MAYRRFRLPDSTSAPANVANPANVRPEAPQNLATLATLAGRNAENESRSAAGVVISLADWRASYEERAAIREYDGGFPRHEAERLAREDVTEALGPEPLL